MANTYDTSAFPLGSKDPRVLYNNASNFDDALNALLQTWVDRFGRDRKTWYGFEQDFNQFLINSGFEPVHLVYTDGQPLQVDRATQLIDRDGFTYRVKMPASFPVTLSGTWATDEALLVDIADTAFRQELAAPGSLVQVGGQSAGDLGDIAAQLTAESDGRLRATTGITVGSDALPVPAERDAFVVARTISVTDRHGFKDNTVIGPTLSDYGGYGSVDVTITLTGPGAFDHGAAFQYRTTYAGSGTLNHLWGFLGTPAHSGSGTIGEHIAIDLHDVSKTGTGGITDNIAVAVRNYTAGVNNVGLNVAQTSGQSIFANGGAPMYHAGPLAVGVSAAFNGVYFSLKGVTSGPVFFADANVDSCQFGIIGDAPLYTVINSGIRWVFGGSTQGYALYPFQDGAWDIGLADKRPNNIRAVNGTIVVSDARHKTEVLKLVTPETADASPVPVSADDLKSLLLASKQMVSEIGVYQMLSAVAEKGADSARLHISMTVQRAMEIMRSFGLDPLRWGFICYDRWGKLDEQRAVIELGAVFEVREIVRKDKTVHKYDHVVSGGIEKPDKLEPGQWWEKTGEKEDIVQYARAAGEIYGFRNEELLFFLVAGLHARLEEQESRIATLEAKNA